MMDLHIRAQAAQEVARSAGEMLRSHGKLKIRNKSDNDFVTEMDVKSENMIRSALLTQFPEDDFFGEEGGGADVSKGRWIVDPIDGTHSFLRGHHGYGISIAYEYEGQLVIGVVFMPDMNEMFVGIRGQGAFLNGEQIHVSEISDTHQALVHLGFGHRNVEYRERMMKLFPDLMRSISDVRRSGSAAYAMCCVACGRSDVFLELGLGVYDVAAGAVIIEEAGGKVTGWPVTEDYKITGNIISTNGLIHDEIAALLD